MSSSLKKNVIRDLEEQGYNLSLSLTSQELNYFYQRIFDMLLYRLQIEDILVANNMYAKIGSLEDYHLLKSLARNHSDLWPKSSRVFDPSFARWFKRQKLYQELCNIFGELAISDEDGYGWPNIYWRIVRPNALTDVGPLHRDSWFWDINDTLSIPCFRHKRVKVWIAIVSEPGINGLLVVPGSHQDFSVEWHSEIRHGIPKPVLDVPAEELNTVLPLTKPGDVIVFHDDLIHGGAINRGKQCRVSAEFTIFIKE